jgi:hypothetical protein
MSSEEVFQKLKSNSSSICEETVRILVKIVDNIVKDPNNLKVRSLQKSNSTVKNKILAIKGGLECLKLLGFQEVHLFNHLQLFQKNFFRVIPILFYHQVHQSANWKKLKGVY